ncbi:putative amidohydrolase [Kineosporia succinea]|uniref:Amidohydrolase n=1 Tax=Kineosporia succinea TaxID=84632 RepID=A0ABT9P2N4_9ACTN|nr:putative amidohydrolase [Kineosporia succinea]
MRSVVRQAAREGARLVLLPEGMLSGYAKAQVPDWSVMDWAALERELDLIRRLARDLDIWLVLGSAHRLTAPNRPHNSLYVISDRGEIVERYDKRLCSHTEITRFYSPGFRAVTFAVDGFRFGLLTCIEVNFPELFAEYEQLGVDGVLLPAYPGESIFPVLAQAHAAINSYWVAVSIPAGLGLGFGSCVFGPDGTPVARAGDRSAVLVADIDASDPRWEIAQMAARPWRARAREGSIYAERRVSDDPRSTDPTCW